MTNVAPGVPQDRSTSWEFATIESISVMAARDPQEPSVEQQPCGDDTDDACEEAIRVLAYFKWEAAGSPEGDGVDYWLEAEREVQANSSGSAPSL